MNLKQIVIGLFLMLTVTTVVQAGYTPISVNVQATAVNQDQISATGYAYWGYQRHFNAYWYLDGAYVGSQCKYGCYGAAASGSYQSPHLEGGTTHTVAYRVVVSSWGEGIGSDSVYIPNTNQNPPPQNQGPHSAMT
jgi:hypothetical protein